MAVRGLGGRLGGGRRGRLGGDLLGLLGAGLTSASARSCGSVIFSSGGSVRAAAALAAAAAAAGLAAAGLARRAAPAGAAGAPPPRAAASFSSSVIGRPSGCAGGGTAFGGFGRRGFLGGLAAGRLGRGCRHGRGLGRRPSGRGTAGPGGGQLLLERQRPSQGRRRRHIQPGRPVRRRGLLDASGSGAPPHRLGRFGSRAGRASSAGFAGPPLRGIPGFLSHSDVLPSLRP